MKRSALVLIALVGVVLVLIWALQRRFIYFPSPGPVPAAADVIVGARDVTLETSDGLELGAWLVPARGTDTDVTVLVANGNGGDRSLRAPLAEALADKGLSVLLFDYRGYGGNPGSPSEEGLALDARAARDFLVEEHRGGRLIYFGESLGAAVATELAAEFPPAGLLLRSPFTDLAAVGREHYPFLPVKLLLRDRFEVVEKLREVSAPTTVVYGTMDSIVPPEQSRAVARAAPSLVQAVDVDGAGHNDLALLNGDELIRAAVDLAERIRG
ncbi:MAG: alpha/beta hydrolase [Actinomycetota bacterium]